MDEKRFEKMENYLLGQLSAEEAATFEQEMAADEAFRQEVEQHKKLIGAIEAEGVRQLLEQIHEEHFAEGNTEKATAKVVDFKPHKWRNVLAIAASVSLLLVAGWWVFTQQATPQQKLYANYFDPAEGLPTTLGATDDPRFAEGMVSYKLGNYAEALAFWQPLLETGTANDTLNYFAGVALLAGQQPAQAIERLQPIAQQPQSAYQTDAQWYLALAYLLEGQQATAREMLQELSSGQHTYTQKSREILQKMD